MTKRALDRQRTKYLACKDKDRIEWSPEIEQAFHHAHPHHD
jgi:hypothetical protein